MVEKYLTPDEVAERYNITPAAVRNWLRGGKLRGVRLGSIWRVPESSLEFFIAQSTSDGLTTEAREKVPFEIPKTDEEE